MHSKHRWASKIKSENTKKKFRNRCQMTDLVRGSNVSLIGMHEKDTEEVLEKQYKRGKAENILVQLEDMNLQLESTLGRTSKINMNHCINAL